jgi:hypothetical protein
VACLSPCDRFIDENLSTLQYASRAQSIENRAVINVDPTTKLIHRLKKEIKVLRRDLIQARRLAEVAQYAVLDQANLSTDEISIQCRKLKKDMIDNITMIKQMYTNENALRQEHDQIMTSNIELTYRNSQLHTENVKLRNEINQLNHYYSTGATRTKEEGRNSRANEESMTIPGYGIARMRSKKDGHQSNENGGSGSGVMAMESARTDNGRLDNRSSTVQQQQQQQQQQQKTSNSGESGSFFDMVEKHPTVTNSNGWAGTNTPNNEMDFFSSVALPEQNNSSSTIERILKNILIK